MRFLGFLFGLLVAGVGLGFFLYDHAPAALLFVAMGLGVAYVTRGGFR